VHTFDLATRHAVNDRLFPVDTFQLAHFAQEYSRAAHSRTFSNAQVNTLLSGVRKNQASGFSGIP
jgi:hypothetical protein